MHNEIVLVTGGTGFVAMRIILELLEKGYIVRTTVRSLNSKNKILETLISNGISQFDNLSFIEAELTQDNGWLEAMKGCRYVLSVASPVFFEAPKNEREAIRPAVEGITRILKFAKAAGVKRVVMTSNFGAVGFSNTNKNTVTTEQNWTDIDLKGLSVYEKSKTLAERAAWDFIEKDGKGLEFATINPVAILGPSLSNHISGSFFLLENLLNGTMKAVPNIPLNVVDVRDVADLHIRAMIVPEANGQRFIASADGQITIQEIALLLKEERPAIATNVTTKKIPDFILKLAALFNIKASEGVMLLNVNRNISNEKAKRILEWIPIASQEQTILASVDSMIQHNIINKK